MRRTKNRTQGRIDLQKVEKAQYVRLSRNGNLPPSLPSVKTCLGLVAFLLVCSFPVHAAEGESMADRTLKRIVAHQKELFADAEKQGDKLDESAFQSQVQSIVHDYELLMRENPKFAAGFSAYGFL